jgi:hypothetical protein
MPVWTARKLVLQPEFYRKRFEFQLTRMG